MFLFDVFLIKKHQIISRTPCETVALVALAGVWLSAMETELGAALWASVARKGLFFLRRSM